LIENRKYLDTVTELLSNIEETQLESIEKAASCIKKSLDGGGVLHAFSTGHSHMLVEEIFYRAGGLVPVNPILDPAVMLHEGVIKSTNLEKLDGYARVIFNNQDLRQGEPIVIISNSGINPVPVEMAMLAKERSMKVIAVTSCSISGSSSSRHPSGARLMDIADIVLDNCISSSDASIKVEETGQMVAAVSTIAGVYILQRVIIAVVNRYTGKGEIPPVFMSANVKGGYEFNENLINKYKTRIKGF